MLGVFRLRRFTFPLEYPEDGVLVRQLLTARDRWCYPLRLVPAYNPAAVRKSPKVVDERFATLAPRDDGVGGGVDDRWNAGNVGVDGGTDRAVSSNALSCTSAPTCSTARHGTTLVTNLIQQRIDTIAPEGSGLAGLLRRHDERMGFTDGD